MFPAPIDPSTQSAAERALYAAFRDQLDDDYTVFHSVAWQALDDARRPRDGEADFVVAHPDLGILVLEVKGGAIGFNPATGVWTSTDRWGALHRLDRDPFRQAVRSHHTLLRQLKRMTPRSAQDVNIGHAVAFPDTVLDEHTVLGLDKPRDIILDARDVSSLPTWIERVLRYYRGSAGIAKTSPGREAIQALRQLLSKTIEIRPALWGQFLRERDELVRLTQEQYRILDALNRRRRAAISGPAGSGKTMLAVEKAARLARQGFRVLLTCYNRPLAADLRVRLADTAPNLDIHHFHGLCTSLAHKAGIRVGPARGQDYFERQLPEALMQAADRLGAQYDAVIVDEGQDFRDTWWIPLQMLLHDPDQGILYVFYDDNQRLYSTDRELPVPLPPFPLTANCRNTQAIHRVLLKFYQGEDPPTVQGPAGRPVRIVEYVEPDHLSRTLGTLLDELTANEGIPPKEIVVLTPFAAERSAIWADPPAGRVRLVDTWPAQPSRVYCGTIHSFKGLERGVVVLAELDHWPGERAELDTLLYVGSSRACNQLVVLLPKGVSRDLRRAFTS